MDGQTGGPMGHFGGLRRPSVGSYGPFWPLRFEPFGTVMNGGVGMIPRASVLITTELDSDVGTLGGLCAARGAVRSSLDPVKMMPGAPPRGHRERAHLREDLARESRWRRAAARGGASRRVAAPRGASRRLAAPRGASRRLAAPAAPRGTLRRLAAPRGASWRLAARRGASRRAAASAARQGICRGGK